jgi:hypothetical protein
MGNGARVAMKKNKIFIISVMTLVLVIAAAAFYAPQIITEAAKRQLGKTFAGSAVSIGKCRLHPARALVFSNVEIKKEKVYDLKIREINITYSVLSLFKGDIARVQVDGVKVTADLRRSKTLELQKMVSAGAGGYFRVREIDISGLDVDLKARDIDVKGTVSLKLFPEEQCIQYIDALIATLKTQGATIEECRVTGPISDAGADVSVKKIKYNDAVITGITGTARIAGPVLSLDLLSARLFKGDIKGKAEISSASGGGFSIALNCASLDLGTFTRDFKLEEKAEVTGKLKGEIFIGGAKSDVTDIHGGFSTDAPGGVLIIKDTSFLEKMAKESKQPVNVLMENFKNYRYNIGVMKVSLDKGNLNLDIQLEGDTGKRVFNVTLHDIFATGSGK